jgi:hypothetical protein
MEALQAAIEPTEYKAYIMSAIPVSGVLPVIWGATLLKRGRLWELP